jgi:Rieske Fe-S protein
MSKPITRRETLHLVVVSAAAVTASCYLGGSAMGPSGDTPAGNLADLPVGTLRALPAGTALAIGRDANGVYALTTICTHEGCDITNDGTISGSGLFCACHGSLFDAQGNVLSGPALTALQHFSVTVDATGNITVHGDRPVATETRATV